MNLSITELSSASSISERNIRFYIQKGMVDRPEGGRRNARYTAKHLEQLLTIRKWQEAGLSLDAISQILTQGDTPPIRDLPKEPGAISVVNHIHLSKGVELIVDVADCGLTTEQIRELAQSVVAKLSNMSKEQ